MAMDDFQIPKLNLDKANSDLARISDHSTWTNWLETLFTLCDNLDQLCHAIDPQFPTFTHELETLDCSENSNRMNAHVLKQRLQQTLERDTILSSNPVISCVKRSETDPNESNRYMRASNHLAHPNTLHKSTYPCNLFLNNTLIPQNIQMDLSRRNISSTFNGGYTYSPISTTTNGSNTEQYCYNDTFNLDYQYQLYLDAWAQSVQPQNLQADSHQFDCKDMVYSNYQYNGPNVSETFNTTTHQSILNNNNHINYDGSTTPTTSTPNYSPTSNTSTTTRRRKDDLSVPKATNEFDYLLSMPSQRIPVNSKDDMKCEIAGVYWDKRSWIASWYEDGKRYYKSFSARTHGFYRSKYFAIQIRLGKVRQNIIKQQRPRPRRINRS